MNTKAINLGSGSGVSDNDAKRRLIEGRLEGILPDGPALQMLSVADSGTVIVTVDGGDKTVLSQDVLERLGTIFDAIGQIDAVSGVVITSGPKGIYGADAREIAALQTQGESAIFSAVSAGKDVLLSKIGALNIPSVAAIRGTWLGGGLELALACRTIIASSSSAAEECCVLESAPIKETKMGLVEVMLGVIPGFGGCLNMYRRVGLLKAIDLICSSRVVSAREAWKMGLVNELAEPAEFLERAEELACGATARSYRGKWSLLTATFSKLAEFSLALYRRPFPVFWKSRYPIAAMASKCLFWITAIPLALFKGFVGFLLSRIESMALSQIRSKTRSNMPAPEAALKVLLACARETRDKALMLETTEFVGMALTQESRNLVGVFLAKSGAKKVLAETGIDPHARIKRVGVIGLGVMGGPIAALCSSSGYQVVALDVDIPALQAGGRRIREFFEDLVASGDMSTAAAEDKYSAIKFTTSYDDLADCDLVIEVAPERLELKRKIKGNVDAVMQRPYYFASNTSTQSNTKIVEMTEHRERAAGIHFFNPVSKMLLVEVVRASDTCDETYNLFRAFVASLGKLPIRSQDRNGFIVNSLIGPYAIAALRLAEMGVPIDRIDRAAKDFGLPMGPFQLADLVGHDVLFEVLSTLNQNFGDRFAVPNLLLETRKMGLIGNKGGEGFFVKNEAKPGWTSRLSGGMLGGKPKPYLTNPKVTGLLAGVSEHKMSIEAIQFVLFDALHNEAVRLLSEQVAESPQELDMATVFGMGYPPYRGGPIANIRRQGKSVVRNRLTWLERNWGENYRPVADFDALVK